MMLRKRSKVVQKEQSRGQLMADSASDSPLSSDATAVHKSRSTASFFSVPGLFVGFAAATKGSQDSSDSARSPTSPLDYRVFSSLGSPFVRSPRTPGLDSPRKSWECDRVGLGLVDSLADGTKPKPCGKVLGSSESRNILLGSQLRSCNNPIHKTRLGPAGDEDASSATSPKSLPKNYVICSQTMIGSPCFRSLGDQVEPGELGKIQSCSLDIGRSSSSAVNRLMYRNPKSNSEDLSSESKKTQSGPSAFAGGVDFGKFSGSLPVSFGSRRGFVGSLFASDIELSEDYTRVISHGPNPKTTHIFGDCILESHTSELPDLINYKQGEETMGSSWMLKCSEEDSLPSPAGDFLSACYSCKKKLEEGKDIFMYRGEKAFCSCNCRTQEILIEEEMEKPAIDSSDSPRSVCYEEIFPEEGMVFGT